MKKVGLIAVLAVLALACGGEDGTTSAGAEALCREYCTCSNDANPACLNDCTPKLLQTYVCARNEYRRYISCMNARACADPFDDCESGNAHPSYEACQEEVEECRASCEPGVSECEYSPGPACSDLCIWRSTCEQVLGCQGCLNILECYVTGECERPETP